MNTTALRPKKRKKTKNEIAFICVMLALPVLHLCVFWLYINIDSIFLSFQELDMASGQWVWTGFDNYASFFREFVREGSVLPRALLNSFSIFFWNDFVIVPVSIFCAYILYKRLPLENVFKVIFFLPSVISVVVLTLAYSYMFDVTFGAIPKMLKNLGLGHIVPFDGYFGDKAYAWWMILIYGLWSGIGYNIVLVSGAMARIPEDVIEAGKLDGLTIMREMFSVTVPLIGPTIGTLMLLGTTTIFTYFLQPQLLLGGAAEVVGGYTIAMYIVNNVRGSGSAQMAMGATVGILCAIVGTPIVFLCRKAVDKFFPAYEY